MLNEEKELEILVDKELKFKFHKIVSVAVLKTNQILVNIKVDHKEFWKVIWHPHYSTHKASKNKCLVSYLCSVYLRA